VENRHLAT